MPTPPTVALYIIVTYATSSFRSTVSALVNQIGARQFMPLRTVSLRRLPVPSLSRDPASNVYHGGNRFQMGRIDAAANSAKMVQLEPLRYRSPVDQPRNDMGPLHGLAESEIPIAISIIGGGPKPAPGVWLRRDLRPKSFQLFLIHNLLYRACSQLVYFAIVAAMLDLQECGN